MTELSYNDLKSEYVLQSDEYDPWGSGCNALFDVSAELWWRNQHIPWEYSPGALAGINNDPREPESYFAEVCEEASTDALLRFGELLDRYTDKLRAAGKDY